MDATRTWLGAALAVAMLAPLGGAQELGIAERFGPDGLPFSHDDPLAVGASASKVRFGAMAADSCSEDVTHPHPGTGTDVPSLAGHPQRDSVSSYGNFPAPNLILDAPFDLTMWIAGINLTDGRVGRFRMFPEDPNGWLENLDYRADERGWIDGWTNYTEPDLGALMDGDVDDVDTDGGAGDKDMANVWSPGPQVKNLHLETLGLSYRDVKASSMNNHGLPIAVKQDTLETLSEFWAKFENKVNELHLATQQAYIEGWVTELMNLDTKATGISGNFVLDLTGEQIVQRVDYSKKKCAMGLCCEIGFTDLPFDLGGPVVHNFLPSDTITSYFLRDRWDYLWSYRFEDGAGCDVANFFGFDIEGKAREETAKKLEPMDLAAELMEGETVDAREQGSHIMDGLDENSPLYQVIAAYSGLAGVGSKNVFDKFALAVMIFFAQFKPTEWSPWAYVDASESMMGFEPDEALLTTQQVLQAENGYRYNNGSSYLGKAMWIFGNSGGTDGNGLGQGTANAPQAKHRFGDTDTTHAGNLQSTPDILQSYAMEWLHVRMDIVDPYELSEDQAAAVWREKDILVNTGTDGGDIRIDWPPPNYGFGRAQVVGFRASSGGTPIINTENIADVNPDTVQIWQGLVCVDPVTRTYSLLGVLDKGSDANQLDFSAAYRTQMYNPDNLLTWSEPRALGPGGTTADIRPDFDEGTPYRWLTAGANHYREADTVLQWGWDFDTQDGGDLDSFHAQHMSDVQGAEWGAVFSYQPQAAGGNKGRTGFAFVDMNLPINP